jgi:hypothetical protein
LQQLNSSGKAHAWFNSRVPLPNSAQPGHWLGPVTGLGRLGPAPPYGLGQIHPKKSSPIWLGLRLCFGLRECFAKHTLMLYSFVFTLFYFDI